MTNPQKWLRRFSKFTVFSTLFLIFLGAWTTGEGLSIFSYIFGYLYNSLGSDLVGGIILLVVVGLIIRYVTQTQEGSE